MSACSYQPCGPCGGSGTVPIDRNDRRKGERTCDNCGGSGTVGRADRHPHAFLRRCFR